jgi:glycosyltransferase involved in cell wall biosynthesis
VIPCYRCAAKVRRAVASVASQSLLPTELILVDDGSGDDTLAALSALREEFGSDWIKVVSLPENSGAGDARNAGWKTASGRYIAFLDADDVWHPRKIEIQHAFMEAHTDIALSGHGHRQIKEGELVSGALESPGFRDISFRDLLLSNRFVTPSVMVRDSVRLRFLPGSRYMEDHLLWLEITAGGARAARLNEVLAFIYKNPFGESGLSARMFEMEKAELANYWRLKKNGVLGLAATLVLSGYSLAKYVRRMLLVLFW